MKRKNNTLTIMKKELRRILGDRRMLLTMFLPGILLYLLYTVMGNVMIGSMLPSDDDVYPVAVEHMPTSIGTLLSLYDHQPLQLTTVADEKAGRRAVEEGDLALYVVFPVDFDDAVAVYDPTSGTPAPEVRIYYNSSSTDSSTAYAYLTSVLDAYESSMTNRFDVNRAPDGGYDLAKAEDLTGMLMSMLMPMLLTVMLFSGCMAVAPESIAGEKERGTLATLLVTPMRRSELALGKIGALSIVSLISGLWSFLGIMLALPKLMGDEETGLVDADIYGVTDYLFLLAVILSTILVYISLISVLSALARSVKEAAGMISPLMIFVSLIGLSGMIFPQLNGSAWAYLIPVYNSAQIFTGIFSLSYQPLHVLLTVMVNLAVTSVLVVVLTQMFNSEKIIFKK